MAGDSLKFRSENSVLSKINGTPTPEISQDITNSTSDANDNGNSKISDNQNKLSAKEGQGLNKVNNSQDPAKGSDGLSVNDMKNQSNVKPSQPELGSIREQKIETTNDKNGNVTSKSVQGPEVEEKGWLETKLMEAMGEMMSDIGEGNKNVDNPKSAEKENIDSKTKNTPKSQMGRVPALDAQKPSPEIPKSTGEREIPSPKMPPRTPANAMPRMNMPKVSVPKMRFR